MEILENKHIEDIKPTFSQDAIGFHQQLPGYTPTPLIDWPVYASQHHFKNLFIKDESQRFGLKAFKSLGGSYAMFRILCKRNYLNPKTTSFDQLRSMDHHDVTFVCATDGNHGHGVSWAASLFGCAAYILMPKGSSEARRKRMERKNVQAVITDLSYDQAVQKASDLAQENHWILIQDTAWEGYTQIPTWIIEGYLTMAQEIIHQMTTPPTHIFLQAGVGAMAGGMIDAFSRVYPTTQFIIVESAGAPCLYASMNQGKRTSIACEPTIMAGLNCGTPCLITWPIIQKRANYFCVCEDDAAIRGMHVLKTNDMVAGESSAVTMGLLDRIVKSEILRNQFQMHKDASILLINTEGDTDPFFYQSVVGEDRCLII